MPVRRKPVVLVVDDHEAVARTLAWVLEASGYVTAVAHTGKDAVELASKVRANVAVVDVGLPDVDGIKAAAAICNILPHCQILLISGDLESVPLVQQQDKFEVLAKPVEPPELLKRVAGLLSRDRRK
jgi:DNA-binding response OmpR family regulator